MDPAYTYACKIRKITDGDTVRADLDLGCGVWLFNEPIRLYGINAPEIRRADPRGHDAKGALSALCESQNVVVETIKDKKGKYGRYLGVLWVDGVNLCERMVEMGHAVKRSY